jgi:hypothetical protein
VRLRIVGVIRSLWYTDDIGGRGSLIPSPGLMARYRANFLGAAREVPLNAIVRLRGGAADLPAFRADLGRVSRGSSIDVLDLATLAGHYRSVTAFESGCLLAFALAAFLAGLVPSAPSADGSGHHRGQDGGAGATQRISPSWTSPVGDSPAARATRWEAT